MEIPPIRDPIKGTYNIVDWTPVMFSWEYLGGVPHEVIHPELKSGMLIFAGDVRELVQYDGVHNVRRLKSTYIPYLECVMMVRHLGGRRIEVLHKGELWQVEFPGFFLRMTDVYPEPKTLDNQAYNSTEGATCGFQATESL